MRFYNVLLLVFSILFLSCETEKNEVTIIGKIIGEIPENVEYTIPINGTWFYGSKQTIKPDSLGNFQINFNIDSPSFITLYIPKANGTLLLESGETYNITFNPSSNDKKFLVTGKNAKAQNVYNTFPNPDFAISGIREFLKDSIPSVISSKIKTAKEKEILLFKELYDKGEISEDFFKLVKQDRDCYYTALKGNVALYKFMEGYQNNNEELKVCGLNLWREAFDKIQITSLMLIRSPWFYALTENYIKYNEYTKQPFDLNKLIKIDNEGDIHSHNIQESQKYLNEDGLEYYKASYLYYQCWQNKNNSKELITLYNNFKKEYPTSKYNEYLTHIVTPVIEFHKKVEEVSFNYEFKFIDNFENIDTFEELTKTLKGKKVYIDIWGTWCGPCKEEFQYKDNLNKLLKSKNISILYICEGRNSKEKVWQEMIKGYELNGYHIMANEKLMADIFNIFGQNGSFSYPRYILIDENGEIIFENAKRPSEIKELSESINIF